MKSRHHSRTLIESLETRTLMAGDAGLIGQLPILASNSFLLSQSGGISAIQINSNEGVAIALSLQSGSSLDLTGTSPTAFLAQSFFLQRTQVPATLPNSMVAANPIA